MQPVTLGSPAQDSKSTLGSRNVGAKPVVSVVVASRNDDHGGDLMRRMQIFVTALLEQSRRHAVPMELVIVEWNPPFDRPRLAEALQWPVDPGPWSVRVIEVPANIHARYRHSDGLPLFQMIAKNVGIRRASAPFVLATNIDLIFSDEMVRFFGSGRMEHGRMYRADRYDVTADVPDTGSLDEQLEFCRHHVIRLHHRDGTLLVDDPAGGPAPSLPAPGVRVRLSQLLRPGKLRLHTNACGDFTLMALAHWEAVRGYAELEMFSFKIDGLLCYAAHFAGAREHVLRNPKSVYHIEHAPGSGWSPGKGETMMDARLKSAGIPRLTGGEYRRWIDQMVATGQPIIFNESPSWGIVDENLPETVLTGRRNP